MVSILNTQSHGAEGVMSKKLAGGETQTKFPPLKNTLISGKIEKRMKRTKIKGFLAPKLTTDDEKWFVKLGRQVCMRIPFKISRHLNISIYHCSTLVIFACKSLYSVH